MSQGLCISCGAAMNLAAGHDEINCTYCGTLVTRPQAEAQFSGHWFVFTNRQKNRVKILFWDGSGLWCCAKRLEQNRFSWVSADQACVTLRGEELIALLSGLEVRQKAGWYRR